MFRKLTPRPLVLVLALALAGLAAPATSLALSKGQADPSFGSGGTLSAPGIRLLATAVQSDGKVVAVGDDEANPARMLTERFNVNGTVDSSFDGGHPALGPNGTVADAVTIQSDGKIVVAGTVTSASGAAGTGMVVERLTTGGAADGGFGSGGFAVLPLAGGGASALALQADGRIILGGTANGADGYPETAFARLNSNGTPDGAFGAGGRSLVNLGKYSEVNSIALQGDGRIVFAGSARPGLQMTNALVARLNANGSLDTSFAGGAYTAQLGNGNSPATGVAVQSDGKIVVVGAATSVAQGSSAFVLRLTSGGGLDGSFGSAGGVSIPAAQIPTQCCNSETQPPGATSVVLAAGEIFVGGIYDQYDVAHSAIWGLTSNGGLDGGFGSGGHVYGKSGEPHGLAVGPDGRLVIAGFTSAAFTTTSSFVSRYGGPAIAPPPPPPPPPTKFTAGLGKLAKSYKISSVRKSGLKVSFTCDLACSAKASLVLSASGARSLKLKTKVRSCKKVKGRTKCKNVLTYRAITVASASGSRRSSGTTTLTLRFSRSFSHAIAKSRKVSLTLAFTATSSTKKKISSHQTVTLAH